MRTRALRKPTKSVAYACTNLFKKISHDMRQHAGVLRGIASEIMTCLAFKGLAGLWLECQVGLIVALRSQMRTLKHAHKSWRLQIRSGNRRL